VASSLLADEKPRVHTVYNGQTLGMIARRYVVTIDAICNANGIQRRTPIKPGQKLVIPTRRDKDGEQAKKWVREGKGRGKGVPPPQDPDLSDKGAKTDDASDGKAGKGAQTPKTETKKASPEPQIWKRYVKPARRRGYVVLRATGRRWSGYAIVKGNRISSRAHHAFQRVLYSWRTGDEHDVDPKLIRLLVAVSDKFGGRPLTVVSGFREHSFARESKHKLGRACDFSIDGIPNEALFEYLSTLEGVGVGYYPNSTFVHLDVRPKTTHWVDYAGPGEAPRKTPREGDAGPASGS
jgi:LysM repeat protein